MAHSVFQNLEYGMRYYGLVLDPVDVYVLLKVAAMQGDQSWLQNGVASEIGVSPSVVNRALKKGEEVRLYNSLRKRINARHLEEALVYGARYFMAPKKGGEVRGTPTAWAAQPLVNILSSSDALPYVWPDPVGEVRGLSVQPLHPSAAKAARQDPRFYELLALVDTLRLGGARERALAERELHQRLGIKEVG